MEDFSEFFKHCIEVKWQGMLKSLWLMSIAAACWSLWIARNEEVFSRKLTTMGSILFQSKLRSLLWVRSVHNELMVSESSWCFCPLKCRSNSKGLKDVVLGWRFLPKGCLKFNVSEAKDVGIAGIGGVLRDEEGFARALFSGSLTVFFVELQ